MGCVPQLGSVWLQVTALERQWLRPNISCLLKWKASARRSQGCSDSQTCHLRCWIFQSFHWPSSTLRRPPSWPQGGCLSSEHHILASFKERAGWVTGAEKAFYMDGFLTSLGGSSWKPPPDDFSSYLLGKNEPTSPLLNRSLEEGHLSMVNGL